MASSVPNHQNKIQKALYENWEKEEGICPRCDEKQNNEIRSVFDIKKNNDEERFTFMFKLLQKYEVDFPLRTKWKDSKISADLRAQANYVLVNADKNVRKLLEALTCYNKSIAFAPEHSQELAFGYGSRSTVLFELKKYEECLQDIDMALSLKYPDHLVTKLWRRKINCLKFINKTENMIDKMRKDLENTHILSSDDKKTFSIEIEKSNKVRKGPVKMFKKNNVKELPVIENRHEKYPCASSAIEVAYNKEFGRHIIANRDIKCNEVLIIEEAFCKMVKFDYQYSHCANCLKYSWSAIPCKYCNHVVYCSETCKIEAWKNSHDIECSVFSNLLELEIKTYQIFFAVRAAIKSIRQAENLESLKCEIEKIDKTKDPLTKGFSDDGKFLEADYRSYNSSIFTLESECYMLLMLRSIEAVTAAFYIATCTTLLGKRLEPDRTKLLNNKQFRILGMMILRLEHISKINHSYGEYYTYEDNQICGSSAQPFCSLLNHSCVANSFSCTAGNYKIYFSVRPIKKGSQIFDDYAGSFYRITKQERQAKFGRYFTCNCVACKEDWPLLQDIPVLLQSIDKGQEGASLRKLRNDSIMIIKINEKINEDLADTDIVGNQKIYSELIRIIEKFDKHLPNKPYFEFVKAIETFSRLFSMKYGNLVDLPSLRGAKR